MNPPPPAAPVPERRLPLLLPHLVWEGVLLLIVIAVVVAAAAQAPLFEAAEALWWQIGTFGLLATGLALSIRTATPNLAIGALAALTGSLYAWSSLDLGLPVAVAALLALLVATGFGLVLGLIVGLTSAPAWAVSLGGVVLAFAAIVGLTGQQIVRAEPLLESPVWWLVAFVLVSVAGGVAWMLLPGVARWLGVDHVGERPARFRVNRLVAAVVGFTGSSLLGGLAGLAMVSRTSAVVPDFGISSLLVALGAVLIGGVSAAGGRGGIVGTALGTVLVSVVTVWLTLEGVSDELIIRQVLIGLLILVGVGVGRGLTAATTAFSAPAAPAPVSATPSPTGGT